MVRITGGADPGAGAAQPWSSTPSNSAAAAEMAAVAPQDGEAGT
jgi:hypothetical protein